MRVLITGVAGFIGYHVAARLLERGVELRGLDNLSDGYDTRLKEERLQDLERRFGFDAAIIDIGDAERLANALARARADVVLHLSAQASARYSLTHPQAYAAMSLMGFANLLEACRRTPPKHLLYASSSAVYGGNRKLPSAEDDSTDKPLSLYGAAKRANEGMAYSYGHLFGIPATGLRFFSIYGEWGRPDMAIASFAEAITAERPIEVFNEGRMARDFTYAGDAAEAVARLIGHPPPPEDGVPHRTVNIASGRKVALMEFIAALEASLGRRAEIRFSPGPPGDVEESWADVARLAALTGFAPETTVGDGIARYARWFLDHRRARLRA